MNAFQRMNTALLIDESKKIFKVSRRAFVDPDILEAERAQIFDKCWLYLGHSSELAKPGDFVTRSVGGRNILFARDGKGVLKAMLNTCPHRGAQVCREKHGSAKSFQCFYHGWVFGLDVTLRSHPRLTRITSGRRAAVSNSPPSRGGRATRARYTPFSNTRRRGVVRSRSGFPPGVKTASASCPVSMMVWSHGSARSAPTVSPP